MSAAKHTPGLWSVSKAKHMGGEHVIAVIADCRGDRSLVIHAPQGDETQDDANASLIAAAPKLLEALEDLLEDHVRTMADEFPDRDPEDDVYVKFAREVIAEATGSAA